MYTEIKNEDILSVETYENEKLPTERDGDIGVLNKIQKEGLLTYEDYCFLVNILATPRRYLGIVFHCFDISADNNVEAKEFAHVMANVTNYKGNPDDLMKVKHSGLMNYLFGKDRKREVKMEGLRKLQEDLHDDVMWLEFTRYSKDGKTISDLDFCNYILLSSNITSRKRKQMMKRVKKATLPNSITFDEFKGFYRVLAGGSDLERALFFLNDKKEGINSDEFLTVARWVANTDVAPHIVDLIFVLLDDDNDKHLSIKEFTPVLFQWRNSRGFHHQSLQFILGHLRI